ncbi:MAG: cytochrome d ubiquinol oxidase subunit II [Tunicatimonas sp.]
METLLGIDYPTWWFLIVGALFSGYAVLDGFDLGAGALHLFFRKEESRRIAINAIGPVWDGNEVWLVIGGGALFAGFPVVYASAFSAFYIPFMLFLVFLIFRAISIEFRSKEPMRWWRRLWDINYSVSSTLLALALGLVLGNVVQGIALDERYVFVGSWLDFLNPYALLISVTTLALFMMHGAIYLVMKTEDRLYAKLTIIVKNTTIFFVVMFVITTLATLLYQDHLILSIREEPYLFAVPVVVVLVVANITRTVSKKHYVLAFVSSSLTICLLFVLVAIGLYPVLLPSTLAPANDITIYKAASSTRSLQNMLIIVAIGFPLVVSYTGFVFYTFRGKVKIDDHSY